MADIRKFQIGTGTLYLNGRDVGVLKGDVTFTHEIEQTPITGGSPEQIFFYETTKEEAYIEASALEININTLAEIMPNIFTLENTNDGDVEVNYETVKDMSLLTYRALQNQNITEDPVTVYNTSFLTADVYSGATVLPVEDTSIFTAGDEILLVGPLTTTTRTIAASGVNSEDSTITLTSDLDNGYSLSSPVAVKSALTVETDFRLDRIDGRIVAVTGGDISERGNILVSYTYTAKKATQIFAGGKASGGITYPVKFVSKRRTAGKALVIRFWKASFTGDFSIPFVVGDVVKLPIKISAIVDPTKPDGKNLYSISEESIE